MKKTGSIVLALAMVVCLVLPFSLSARAATYIGDGTKSSPYYVTNAEQLQGMRDNLGAYYVLANTIDLSGVEFSPIGRLDAPFPGTFVCPLNDDNTPKYVIKNLNQTVAESPYAAENKNRWEGGLFGATNGATFSGIYVLNANVTNNNYGDNTGSVVWNNYKPGMDEMATGILIGTANNTTVYNCGTTGNVGGKPNHIGGLIGMANSCRIKNCYSMATVSTSGCWNAGGLIGSASNSTISCCYSTGNVTGGQTSAASFIGAISQATTISDCYATGSASCPKEDSTNFTTYRESTGSRIVNCYTTGSANATTINDWGACTIQNCYTISGVTSNMPNFTAADMGTISAQFASGNWTGGSNPTLAGIGVAADASAYQPADVQIGGSTGQTSGTQSQTGTGTGSAGAQTGTGTGTTDTAGENTEVGESTETIGVTTPSSSASEVAAMIEALPDPEVDGSVTLEDRDAVVEALKAYEALSVGDKDSFDANLTSKLYQVRYQLSLLLVSDMIDRVKALPEVDELTADDVEDILAIWEDYNFIDEEIRAEIDDDYVKKIEDAYAFAQEVENTQEMSVEVENTFSVWQMVVICVCGALVVAGVIYNIVSFILMSRRIRKANIKPKTE